VSRDGIETARGILRAQTVASLGTLHAGEPAVSMVPFALAEGSLVVHVSRLSSHTADMLAHQRVSVMVLDEASPGVMPQARARVTIAGDAASMERGSGDESRARAAYLARFPDAAPIFELGDFSLFAIRPRTVRVIAGFGRAETLAPDELAEAIG
jgi:heme iron utilization protein